MEICLLSSNLNIILSKVKKFFLPLIIFLFMGCKNENDLAMERGIQYYEWNMVEKALLEFKFVIHSLGNRSKKLDSREIKLLSRAHYNLAVAYAKKKWYGDAVVEARKAFELFPSDDNRKVLELIQAQKPQKKNTEPTSIDSSR